MAQQQQLIYGKTNVEAYTGNDFGDRLSFTVGSSYAIGSIIGLVRGCYLGIPKSFKIPKKLIMNNFFNSLGKQSSRFGNAFAGAGLMYFLVGGALKLFYEDQLTEFSNSQKNLICGGISGVIYKSTRGVIGAGVGGLLGCGLMYSLTKLAEYGNEKGYIAFELKY